MKHTIGGIFAAALLTLTACTGEKFHIEGNITQATDSLLYLENMSLDGPQVVDSIRLTDDGHFDFSGERPEAPEFYRLRIAGSIINVSIDSTETVTVKAAYPTMASQYTVEGSDNCTRIRELSLMQQRLIAQLSAITSNYQLSTAQMADSTDAVLAQYKKYVRENYIFKAPQHSSSYFALFQAIGPQLIFNPQKDALDMRTFAAVATSWDANYPGALRGENLHNIAIEGMKTQRIVEQQKAQTIDASKVHEVNLIDIQLPDNKGQLRSLTQLRGKVVLLDFHAFAMEGSHERIMMLRELYNKYHAQGLEIFQVSVDDDEHFWKTQTAALPWVCVRDPQGVQSSNLAAYNVKAIPTFFLIDRTNSLYKRDAQVKDIEAEIASLVQK